MILWSSYRKLTQVELEHTTICWPLTIYIFGWLNRNCNSSNLFLPIQLRKSSSAVLRSNLALNWFRKIFPKIRAKNADKKCSWKCIISNEKQRIENKKHRYKSPTHQVWIIHLEVEHWWWKHKYQWTTFREISYSFYIPNAFIRLSIHIDLIHIIDHSPAHSHLPYLVILVRHSISISLPLFIFQLI